MRGGSARERRAENEKGEKREPERERGKGGRGQVAQARRTNGPKSREQESERKRQAISSMEFAAAHDLKTLLKLASLLAANKQSARAERGLRHAIQTAPDDFRGYFNLATLLLKRDPPPSD